MIAYLNGSYMDKSILTISPDDRGFVMADGIYEVVRFYRGKPFKLHEHRRRLENGARLLKFERCTFPEFEEVMLTLVRENDLQTLPGCTVYFQVTRGVAPRSHRFPNPGTPQTVFASAKQFNRTDHEIDLGAAAISLPDERWLRCNIKSIALLPNTLAHQQARDAGAIEAIFIDNGLLREGSHSNVICVKDGVVKTPPLTSKVLAGITRQTVLDLCEANGIKVVETEISEQELVGVDEVAIVGTTVEVTPIVQLNGKPVVDGRPGSVVRQIQDLFFREIGGR